MKEKYTWEYQYKEDEAIILTSTFVYGAKQIDCDINFVRINIGNCQFWNIEGKVK